MNSKPMHAIEIDHDLIEVARIDLGASSEIATMRCADCGAESKALHLKPSEKTHQNQESKEETKEALKRITESLNQYSETMNSYIREMLDGTEYATSETLTSDIAKRYNEQIPGENIPLRWLKAWLDTGTRKAQRKVLLAYKQGLVCNRCHLILPFDELTEDHINHDRNRGQLTDLQLLCKNCNREKGDGPPGKSDISPFKFTGESCIHRLTCTELDAV